MLGRQEIEGVLGKSRKTGFLPDWGQLFSIGTYMFQAMAGPFACLKDTHK
jgi:hypothetical protein